MPSLGLSRGDQPCQYFQSSYEIYRCGNCRTFWISVGDQVSARAIGIVGMAAAAAAGLLEAVAADGSFVEMPFRLSVASSQSMSGGSTMAQLIVIPGMIKRGLASRNYNLVAGDNEGYM